MRNLAWSAWCVNPQLREDADGVHGREVYTKKRERRRKEEGRRGEGARDEEGGRRTGRGTQTAGRGAQEVGADGVREVCDFFGRLGGGGAMPVRPPICPVF